MRLRIVSDGTSNGTTVCNELGETIDNVESVEWVINASGVALARVTIMGTPIWAMAETDPQMTGH